MLKRSGIQRKTPMKSSGIKQRAPSTKTGVLRVAAVERKAAPARKVAAKKKQSGAATNAERAHMGRVAAAGCCLCEHLGYGHTAAEVHHVRVRHGWGRSGHMNTIGLCFEHHRGEPGGVHAMGRVQFAEHYGVSEIELLERTARRLIKSEGEAVAPATPSITKTI